MAIFNQLVKSFKDKAPGQQRGIGAGQVSAVQGQRTEDPGQVVPLPRSGQDAPINPLEQFSSGSERPTASAEREEISTNRRNARSITDNIRTARTAGRFGSRNAF